MALRLARGIKALRDAGYSSAGVSSSFRTGSGPAETGSDYDVAGESSDSIGSGVDMGALVAPVVNKQLEHMTY